MEIKCRCHGLSGSCSLKTCWLRLPDFQQIGAYLRRKYDASVHLPSAVNVNKLIPMMDRAELSAILQSQISASDSAPAEPVAFFAAPAGGGVPSTRSAQVVSAAAPRHFDFYERHKQLAWSEASSGQPPNQTLVAAGQAAQEWPESSTELAVKVAPMSQQQYQALLKELRLCSSEANQSHATSYLTTRDLRGHAQHTLPPRQSLHKKLVLGQQQAHPPPKATHHQLNQLLHNTDSKDNLIHLHKSPDYCQAELSSMGFAGVKARSCSADDAQAPDSCDRLCCGRGYEKRETQLSYNCDCKFQFCCKIHCNYCHKKIVEYVCK